MFQQILSRPGLPKIMLTALVLTSLAMHLPHFNKELVSIHVWRQTQTQSTIINFYEGDMNILNPTRNDRGSGDGIFRMEFPLMQWLVAVVYRVFGNHLIITRICMFIIGIFSVFGMYKLILALFRSETAALAGAWAFNFSPSFFYFTINPIPDNLALCCGTWGLALFFQWYHDRKILHVILSGLFLALGALCKLPFILYFLVPVAASFTSPAPPSPSRGGAGGGVIRWGGAGGGVSRWERGGAWGAVTLHWILLPLAWYAWVIPGWNVSGILHGMAKNEAPLATVLEYLQHNVVSTLPELLLNYGSLPLFLAGIWFLFRNKAYNKNRFLPLGIIGLALIAYFLFEVNMIANVHDYYLFPFLPLLFILVAYGAAQLLTGTKRFLRYFALFCLVILPVTCWIRMLPRWDLDSPGFNKDLLTWKEDLRRAVPKDALCIAGNDASRFIFFYYIDKKGWGFENDSLTGETLYDMIQKGADYLYCDSRVVDENPQVTSYLDQLIMERGSLRVYRLKEKSYFITLCPSVILRGPLCNNTLNQLHRGTQRRHGEPQRSFN